MNAPWNFADVAAHVDRIHAVASDPILSSFHRFERAHNASRPPVTAQSDEDYFSRPLAKPESMWRPM